MTNTTRPFSFEDLPLTYAGKRIEPESWGPRYSKPTKPRLAADRFPTNCPSGQKGDFDAAKHRIKIRTESRAQASADSLAWATGKQKQSYRVGMCGPIEAAYAEAMAEKRAREAQAFAQAA